MKMNNLLLDNALRSVVKRRAEEAERVRLSEDFTDRLMASIEKQKTPSKHKRLWPYAASAGSYGQRYWSQNMYL